MRTVQLGVAAALLAGLVAGCGSSGSKSSSSSGSVGARPAAGGGLAPAAAAAAPKADAQARGTGNATETAVLGRDIIRTGTLSVQTKDIPAAIARAAAVATGAGGYVEGQESAINPKDHRQDTATITLKVPGAGYDAALSTLSRLGTVLSSQDARNDVTGAVIDASSRLVTEEASLARVRTLLSRARTIGEVVAVESELTKREASYESLKGRLAALRGQVSYATITMTLTTPDTTLLPKPHPRQTGFVGGLRAGWHSFAAVIAGLLTAVGAALPFAVALLVIGGAAWGLRHRFARRPAAASAAD